MLVISENLIPINRMAPEKFSLFKKIENQLLLPPSNFRGLMAVISFNIARKELKIEEISEVNQLLQPSNLVLIYVHGIYELSRMLMTKNVNSYISKG